MLRTKAKVAGPGGGTLALLWGVYSNVTTIVELPDKAGALAKVLADPPIYLPWLFLGAFVLVTVWAFWPSAAETVLPEPASQSSTGSHSVNIGTNHGPVTVASPPPAATQPGRSPYGSGRPPMRVSADAVRGAEKLPPLRPNFTLASLVPLVEGNIAPGSDDRSINLAIADWVVQYGVSVWGRYEDQPIQKIHATYLKNARFDHRRNNLKYATDWHSLTMFDVQFNKSEVDEYWI